MRRTEYRLNRALVVITSIIVAMASLSIGFGDTFTEKQKEFINSISDKSLLVINDTLGINATSDYSDAVAFSGDTINYVEGIPNVESVYPHYFFASYGMTNEAESGAKLKVMSEDGEVLFHKDYGNTYLPDGNEFFVMLLYKEESLNGYLIDGSVEDIESNGVYLTYNMAKNITDNPENLIGKYMEICCYVPTKLFISEATRPKTESEKLEGKPDEVVEIDGYVTKPTKINAKICGILNNSYENDKSDNNGNVLLMSYSEIKRIVDDNKETLEQQAFPDFKEKELAPSMLVVFARNFDDVNDIENKISAHGSAISVINRAGDIEKTRENLNGIKQTMVAISIIMIFIVTIMFGLLYYFKNRERNREIGILKAIGLGQRDVLTLVSSNMVKNTILTFGLSISISVVSQQALNYIFGAEFVGVSALSVLLCFIISVITVFISGMFSVWKTSKIDVIDAIRLNK